MDADSPQDARRWSRRITMTVVVTGIVLGLPNFLLAMAHARVDSEVGVMMYGFPLFIAMIYACPVVGLCTLFWGFGLTKARREGEAIPRLERVIFGVIATVTLLLLWLLSGNYLRMAKSYVGL